MSGLTSAAPAHYAADLARFNKALADMGAIAEGADGWAYLNPWRVPERVLDAYSRLLTLGYAQGWLT